MEFALNILALVLVVGLCWLTTMWYASRRHGLPGESLGLIVDGRAAHGDEVTPDEVPEPARRDDCPECEGVGAAQIRGRVKPCPQCEGTGVASAS